MRRLVPGWVQWPRLDVPLLIGLLLLMGFGRNTRSFKVGE